MMHLVSSPDEAMCTHEAVLRGQPPANPRPGSESSDQLETASASSQFSVVGLKARHLSVSCWPALHITAGVMMSALLCTRATHRTEFTPITRAADTQHSQLSPSGQYSSVGVIACKQ